MSHSLKSLACSTDIRLANTTQVISICCIGFCYVGWLTMALIVNRCPGLLVSFVDLNAKRIASCNDPDLGQMPLFEPVLDSVAETFLSAEASKIHALTTKRNLASKTFLITHKPPRP